VERVPSRVGPPYGPGGAIVGTAAAEVRPASLGWGRGRIRMIPALVGKGVEQIVEIRVPLPPAAAAGAHAGREPSPLNSKSLTAGSNDPGKTLLLSRRWQPTAST